MRLVQKSFLRNEAGFSLVDLLVASMMSVIIISICYSVMAFQYNQLRAVKALFVQNILLAQIKAASNPTNLKNSRGEPANIKLRSCLSGIDANCESSEIYYLRLMDGGPVAGFPDDPVGYNLDAQRCVVGTKNCLFTLKTRFRVQCREPASNPYFIPPTCPGVQPGLVEVFYDFEPVNDNGPERVLGLKPVSGSVIVKL